ncbi:hypothetical protein JCM11491_004003 [Sporobolomyces phaffii]
MSLYDTPVPLPRLHPIPMTGCKLDDRRFLSFRALLGRTLFSIAVFSDLGSGQSTHQDLGFSNPTSNGGRWLTRWNNDWAGGEPLNVVISSRSDPKLLEFDTFLDYCASLKFSKQCFQWDDRGSLQAANLGDGNDWVNQSTILRYNYDDPVFGTCSETLQGGNHFRVFRQNGPLANSGAWFLAVSKEFNLAKNHKILPNGYDLGRDELVEIALDPAGTRSPVSDALYQTSVEAVSGRDYFGRVEHKEINHGEAIDGRIAILTVEIVREGNGRLAHSAWFTSIKLADFVIFVGVSLFCTIALFVFLLIHYHHHRRRTVVSPPWERDVDASRGSGGGRNDDSPLLDRRV